MNIQKLEITRKKILTKYTIAMILIIAFLFIAIVSKLYILIPITLVLVFVLSVVLPCKDITSYKKAYKVFFVKTALEKIFTNVHYNPDFGISWDTIFETNMISMGNRYSSNDYISANYKGICFQQSDVNIQREYETFDSEGCSTTHYETLFRGRWMIFDFNKTFKANIQVLQKNFRNSKTNTLYGSKEQLFKNVQMESQEFNKNFKVYAQNEVDAFYILTPHIIEKILNLASNNDGAFMLCFIDNKLHVALYNNKDSFEYGNIFVQINEEKEMKKISNDIQTITQFIDELELDNNLFRVR